MTVSVADKRRADARRSQPPSEEHELHVTPLAALELRTAERDAALSDLAAVVRILIRAGGYLTPQDQVSLRAAMARLAEHGRSVEDAPAPGRSTR